LIGSDGLNSDFLSLYGYEKETTPFLNEFARDALMAVNNFTNANVTTGSLTSMFTGKLPLQTRVQFPPDILKGADAYEHLPGILKREGYYNALISVDYYGDSNAVNLQDGFVTINGRSAAAGQLYAFTRLYLPEDTSFFLSTVAQRLSDRILHVYSIRTMANPYAQVTQKLDSSSDPVRIEQLLSIFRENHQPWFVQVYMMGTHLFLYDSYDDAVKNFDGYVREVVNELKRMGKLDQTIIIVYTDHGKSNQRKVRTPLIIRFPDGEYAGQIVNNTQNLDIPPTILDYLGIEQPEWMDGRSLLKGEPPANRPIFSTSTSYSTGNGKGQLQLDMSKIKPPFYQFEIIDMIICNRWYTADTAKLTWQAGQIQRYPTPCEPSALPDDLQAQDTMMEQLKSAGFDVTALQAAWDGK
jgi:arylsulfatase A-like enzyme